MKDLGKILFMLFAIADRNGGKIKNRVVLFCDEFGTIGAKI